MNTLLESELFQQAYQQLESISLNPERHTAANALLHCEAVKSRARELGELNSCTDEEILTLEALALCHDIGKVTGTANPDESVAFLQSLDVDNPQFLALVKYHDINLPWFIAHTKQQPPSAKAWERLSRNVNLRLLCLFMVADRIDCPGGWKENRPLMWFLSEIYARNLLTKQLAL